MNAQATRSPTLTRTARASNRLSPLSRRCPRSPTRSDLIADDVLLQPTPGLPQPGDAFEPPEAALVQVIQALVPVYGISARIDGSDETWANIYCNRHHSNYSSPPGGRCHFCVRLELNEKIGRWLVDTDGSHFEHNHNRDARIVKDPTWRPTIRMKLARKAHGMEPFVRKGRDERGKMADAGEAGSEGSQSEYGTDDEVGDASDEDQVRAPLAGI